MGLCHNKETPQIVYLIQKLNTMYYYVIVLRILHDILKKINEHIATIFFMELIIKTA